MNAWRAWTARLLISVVVTWNLQCAVVFFVQPQAYAASFELAGVPGEAALRGTGLLFLMWNIPYLVALWNPVRRRSSLWEALAMQAIGLAGESAILALLEPGHSLLRAAIGRFITFDAAGLALLALAIWIVKSEWKKAAQGAAEGQA